MVVPNVSLAVGVPLTGLTWAVTGRGNPGGWACWAVWETGVCLPVSQGAVGAGIRLPASKRVWAAVPPKGDFAETAVHTRVSPVTVNRPLRG